MRKIYCVLFGVALVVGLAACADKKGDGRLDPSAKVYIVPAPMPQSAAFVGFWAANIDATQVHLTPLEIVQQAGAIHTNNWTMGIEDWNRDIENVRFIVGSSWAIGQDGELTTGFIEARDYVFMTLDIKPGSMSIKDTVAYIPNATMAAAEKTIKEAYAAENYPECYRLIQEAFMFVPITGAEWLALKAKGEN